MNILKGMCIIMVWGKDIREHIDPKDRSSLESLSKGGLKRTPL